MSASESYILFDLAGSLYGVRSADVQHIDMLEHLTPVPNTVATVDGVVFSRGKVAPVLNLRARFGLPRQAPTLRTRLIFLKVEQRIVALLVDAAREFRTIPHADIRPIESTLHGINGNYVRGVATVKDRLVLLLDVGAVLTVEETTLPASVTEAAQPVSA